MATGRIGVVGAGIVGLAVARELTLRLPGHAVEVIDKEARVAAHQTGHNSGVVHAGIYYAPGSLKATLCRRGVALLKEYCQEKDLPYVECGKLVVAVAEDERPALLELARRAELNAVPGMRQVEAAELREIEPHAGGVAGLHSPRTAITDFVAVTEAFAHDVRGGGGALHLGRAVTGISERGGSVRIRTDRSEHEFDHLVVCAGLQSDRVALLAGGPPEPMIVPFRGEYYALRPERTHLVNGLIYPVPDPAYPFLGVHYTRRVDGRVDIGPNAVLAWSREGYRRRDVSLRDLADIVRWPGFRTLARQHWRMGMTEYAGSASRRLYLNRARRYLPALDDADVVRAPAGVRAQAVDADGSLVDDFRIQQLGSVTAVRNAPSPAATSSLAIAELVAQGVLDQLSSPTA